MTMASGSKSPLSLPGPGPRPTCPRVAQRVTCIECCADVFLVTLSIHALPPPPPCSGRLTWRDLTNARRLLYGQRWEGGKERGVGDPDANSLDASLHVLEASHVPGLSVSAPLRRAFSPLFSVFSCSIPTTAPSLWSPLS